jgi:cytoskeletal protein RodZ
VPTVGEQLRQAREAQNLTMHQAAEATKLRTDHVRALEEGDYSVFSAPVYIRGSIRTYAHFLKLNSVALVEQANADLAQSPQHHEPSFPDRPSRNIMDFVMYQVSKLNWKIALPVIAVVIILGGGILGVRLWFNHRNKDPLSELKPALYQPKTSPGQTLPLPVPARRNP